MAIAGRASERYHALDALRGAAMFLGIVLHAAIPYMKYPLPFWPLRDPKRSNLFDGLLVAIHDFRMQLFFLLAGFFGCMLYTRRGWRETSTHRLKRIALPLTLALITIQPILQAISVYAYASNSHRDATLPNFFGEALPTNASPAAAVREHFVSGEFFSFLLPTHLWFLWFLLLCFAIMLPLAAFADRLRHRDIGWKWDSALRWLFTSRLRFFILAIPTWPLLTMMTCRAGPDTALGWAPPPHLLAYYFLFFLCGWSLYRHRDLLGRFAGGWKWNLAIGQLLILPVAIGFVFLAMREEKFGRDGSALQTIGLAMLAHYTWLTIGGLMGLFLRCLSRERPLIRWLADSSYWCYLASLPLILLFNFVAVDWPTPAPIKFLFVCVTSMIVLLITYQFAVRYTWIGALLNGPRARPAIIGQGEKREAIPANA